MPKILLLHGNQQTHDVFYNRIKPLTKKLKKLGYTFSASSNATNGPIIHPLKEGDDTETFGWFNRSLEQLPNVLQNLASDFEEHKYEGIIAFSQGSLLAHYLAHDPRFHPYLKWMVLASAPCPSANAPSTPKLSPNALPPNLPSLHVIGSSDAVVPPSSSNTLSKSYSSPAYHNHPGGHHIPMRSSDLQVYLSFVSSLSSPPSSSKGDFWEEQNDELSVLSEIYQDDYALTSTPDSSPITLKIRLFDYSSTPIYLNITFPPTYPETSSPQISLSHTLSLLDFSVSQERLILKVCRSTARCNSGSCCVMQIIETAREWYSDGGFDNSVISSSDEEISEESEEEKELKLKNAEDEGLIISSKHIYTPSLHPLKGGSKKLIIGLIGKPSSGKSTFFNASTSFSRQEGGSEGAKMGDIPFTTITPNSGLSYISLTDFNFKCGSEYGTCKNGGRLIPVYMKDVAGLVPGAWKGRGKGNKFLDDLCEAEVLVLVDDCSGKSDVEGNINEERVGEGLGDVGWIRREMVMWLEGNVWAKFEGVRRLGRERLGRLFTGYRQQNSMIERVLDALEAEGHNVDDFVKWTRVDVRRLVSCFLGFRFPTVLACNKIDKADEGVLEGILERLPAHGIREGVGVCALSECEIVRKAIDGKDTSDLEITENVWKTLSKAVSLSSTVFVYPVIDLNTCMSLPSMVKNVEGGGGSTSATAISENHKKSLAARGGRPPEAGMLQICVCMKEGSTVSDVYDHLKNIKAISGMFVRAEGMSNVGDKSRQLKKEELVNSSNRIMRIMTNKNRAHDSGEDRGGGVATKNSGTSKNASKYFR
ncbi:hypothetical protein TrVE_jg6959 [Triparma verrucosa]|uniref:RWD domain-containing protein n=1 Tax=Triparma verrucosa TaxID=1606542 RepID=A0A9W7BKT7_9STRA|nr:hypothetical protein TrVE_jg6959 [Triparma verrucosa]